MVIRIIYLIWKKNRSSIQSRSCIIIFRFYYILLLCTGIFVTRRKFENCWKVINWFSQNCTKGATPINILYSARWNQRTNPLFNSICHTFRNTACMLNLFFKLVLNTVILSVTNWLPKCRFVSSLSLSLDSLRFLLISFFLSFP